MARFETRWHPVLRLAVPAICGVAAVFIAMASFRKTPTAQASGLYRLVAQEPPYIANSDSVGFDISPVPDSRSPYEWLATYNSRGKTAKFRIILESGKSLSDPDALGLDIQSGTGKFVAVPGSDSSVLLVDLKKALQARVLPNQVKRVASLPFEFASFGKKQSRISDGGFTGRPPGNWTPMKIFLGEGDQESEVFLNPNPVLGKGEFSIKDEDYGNGVVASLASVL